LAESFFFREYPLRLKDGIFRDQVQYQEFWYATTGERHYTGSDTQGVMKDPEEPVFMAGRQHR
jgi:hypothetical protein